MQEDADDGFHSRQQKQRNKCKQNEKQREAFLQYNKKKHYVFGSNIFEVLFFTWISPLLKYGYKVIPQLRKQDQSLNDYQTLNNFFHENMRNNKSKRVGLTLLKSILKSLKKQLIIVVLFSLIVNGLLIYRPILSYNIIQYVSEGNKNIKSNLIYFIQFFSIIFVVVLIRIFLWFRVVILGIKTCNALSLMIFKKTIRYPLLTEKQFRIGDIINYSQLDAQSMTLFGSHFTVVLCTPILIIFSFVLIYFYLGLSFLVGLGVMIFMVFLTLIFFKMVAQGNQILFKAKDERMKVTQQMLQIIKFIKVNVLEKYFFKKITKKRQEQLKIKMKVNLSFSGTILTYFLCSPMIITSILLVYISQGNQITASRAFFTILIFQILQFPLYQLPQAIAQLIQIWTSIKRIQNFLAASQLNNKLIQNYNDLGNNAIEIQNGKFYWGKQNESSSEKNNQITQNSSTEYQNSTLNKRENKNSQQTLQQSLLSSSQQLRINNSLTNDKYICALTDINIKFPLGKITMIIGDVGCGKSSILSAILNQMTYFDSQTSKIKINGSIAYCPQKPWIMAGSVKDNIVFFNSIDQKKLNQVIYYSCLKQDLNILHKGIHTEIGQKGVNLSGGQKARISFARALYANKDIYLLDDILSSVDVHVGNQLMQNAIQKYLKGKTIIMPTHAVKFLAKAHNIVLLFKGRIIAEGTYQKISKLEQFQQILKYQQNKQYQKEKSKSSKEDLQILNKLKLSLNTDNRQAKENKIINFTEKITEQLFVSQDQQIGKVSMEVYKQFVSFNGGFIYIASVLVSMSAWTIFSLISNIQIKNWCEDQQKNTKYLYLYVSFCITAALFCTVSGLVFSFAEIRQGKIVHKKILKSLLYTGLINFYNRVPIGRILNRLSKNLRQMDQKLNRMVGFTLICFFTLLGSLIMLVYTSSLFIIVPILLIVVVFVWLVIYYLTTQRQCVRLQSISNSPMVSGLGQVINGIATVRAYSLQEQFFKNQVQKVNLNKKIKVVYQALRQWLCIRLALLSMVINLAVFGFAIFTQSSNGSLIGLLLAYTGTLIEDMINFAQCLSDLQIKMISVQRLIAFTKLQPESGYVQYLKNWNQQQEGSNSQQIKQGRIQFKNFSTCYREGLPMVLKNITLFIQKGEKIGIVGRTGAGKSTLVNCLLRILQPSQGNILIDNKQLVNYNIKDLRSSITIIEQDPTLMNATFLQNIDPSNIYDKQYIKQFVQGCNISQMIQKKGGLNSIVTNQNLSAGEKQLLCICRAFLKKSKIVLIDQATANIDIKNDQLIQKLIKKAFEGSTVLTIAHRLSTLKNCDKILVLSEGEIIQWGNPNDLLKKQNGIYRKMFEQNDISFFS